ncbi:MAG: hypothetical protein WC713_01795 [Candidatus Methylomirabilota bacterium]
MPSAGSCGGNAERAHAEAQPRGRADVFALSQGLLGGGRIHPIPEATVVKTVTDLFLHGLLSLPPSGARRRKRPVDGAGGPRKAPRHSSPGDPATARRPPDRIAADRRARRSPA